MRRIKCKKCNEYFLENDNNPNIHYSNPSEICPSCEMLENKKIGEWYQDKDGNWKQKGYNQCK